MAKDAPIYEELRLDLKRRIDSGELPEGGQLPSEFELVDQSGLSRHQVRQALRALELEGYIERIQGRGSFVAPRSARSASLRMAGSRAVALSFPQYASHYARQIVEGFLQHMSNSGYQVVAYNMQFDDNSEYDFLQNVRDSGVAGFAIWLGHVNERSKDLLAGMRRAAFPVVLADRYFPDLDIDCVASDNVDIGYRLTRALIERGHRRLCLATTDDLELSSVRERYEGFRKALKEAKIASRGDDVLHMGFTEAETRAAINEMMARFERPTGFVSVNDLLVPPLYNRLVQLGYALGPHFELATVDDDHVSEAHGIEMIRVTQAAYEIGTRSAELLLRRIEDPARPAQRALIKAGAIANGPVAATSRRRTGSERR